MDGWMGSIVLVLRTLWPTTNGANRSTSEIMLRLPTLLLPWTSPTASLRETLFPIPSSYGQDVRQSETMSTTTPPSPVMYPCIILSPYTTRATLLLPPPLPSASATRLPQTMPSPRWSILAWHTPAPMWITPSRYPTAPWPLKTLELIASDRSPESQPLHSVLLPIQCVQLQYHQPNWTYQDHTGKKWFGDQDWFGSVLWVFPEAVAFPRRAEADVAPISPTLSLYPTSHDSIFSSQTKRMLTPTAVRSMLKLSVWLLQCVWQSR